MFYVIENYTGEVLFTSPSKEDCEKCRIPVMPAVDNTIKTNNYNYTNSAMLLPIKTTVDILAAKTNSLLIIVLFCFKFYFAFVSIIA